MHWRSLIAFILALGMISPAGTPAEASRASLDPTVQSELSAQGQAEIIIVLSGESDLEGSAAVGATLRATAISQSLRAVAAATQPGVIDLLEQAGTEYQPFWIANVIAARVDQKLVDVLLARKDVAGIFSNRGRPIDLGFPSEPESQANSIQTGVEDSLVQIGADRLWQFGFTGAGIVVAGADTGVDWDHPALKSKYLGWDGTQADHNYAWWDAVDEDVTGTNVCGVSSPEPCDDKSYSHGTHTMGTMVGDDGAGNQIGVAPGARWMACRNMANGVGKPSWYLACLQFFLAPTDLKGQNPDPSRHADVVNNSYSCTVSEGCTAAEKHVLQSALEALRAAGIFVAASAGNLGPECETVVNPPGIEDSAYTVGAVSGSGVIAEFSGRGPVTLDGANLLKPDLTAPGVYIRSSVKGGGYGYLSGTSMASPHVAGAVALLWSAFPELKGDVAATEALLDASARQRTTTEGCGGDTSAAVPNNVYGYGVLDVWAAFLVRFTKSASFFPNLWR